MSHGVTLSQYQSLCRRKDGGTFPVSVTGSPLLNAAGEVEALSAILRDVSRQMDAEGALIESEERFRTMADGCPALMWVTNAKGEVRFINRAYRELLGTTYKEAEGSRWQMVLHPHDAPEYLAAYNRAVQHHTSLKAQCRARGADGEWRCFESSAEPRFTADGEFLGHVGMSSDITGRKHHEKAVRESQELALAVIDALASHVCVLDESGSIIAVNQAWKEFAKANRGVDTNELRLQSADGDGYGEGVNYLALCDRAVGVDAAGAAEFAHGIRGVLRGEHTQYQQEYSCHSPQEQRWFLGTVTRFVVHNRRRILVEHINITKRKLAEDNLLLARQAAEEQALHHEFQHSLIRAIHEVSLDGILVVSNEGIVCPTTKGSWISGGPP